MVIRPCEPRGSSWSADYRAYAVELYRQFEAGRITKEEMQLLLANLRTRSFMLSGIEWLCSLMMNFVVALSMIQAMAYVSNYVGESPNEMLKSPA